MFDPHILKISAELFLSSNQVQSTAVLLAEGGSVPFIARYRKEVTGSLDEVAITHIRDRLTQLRELDKRREAILESIQSQGKLTDELKEKILAVETMAVLEDLYLPYKPKRRTRATVAKEKGLEPLAQKIWLQKDMDPEVEAIPFVSVDKKVESTQEALAGARDIMAEWINEDTQVRAKMRELFREKGVFKSKVIKGKEQEAIKFKDYFDWQEPVLSAPSHRILAMRRGEKEAFLILRIAVPEEEVLEILRELFVKADNAAALQVKTALEDSYRRLLSLSIETELRLETKERADKEAIKVFAQNLRQLLLAPPLGQKNILALDPGFRTGCKVVCLNSQGKFLLNDVIFPTQSQRQSQEAAKTILNLCERFQIETIAIGNGTASRETEHFIRALKFPREIPVVMVNESGASIYSASEAAREEFPDQDVTVRGAVSIGRRLMDPLAELVKIDPKSIGVGQYQHDVDQGGLKQSLDDVVVSCVNLVGVEVNTASKELLMYVSGLGGVLARSIVDYRNEHGPFKFREEFKNVHKLGAKAFEQAAGFLRIRDAENPLDASAVHPESYSLIDQMAKNLGCSVGDLIKEEKLRERIDLHKYITETIGLPTLTDIKKELAKPGRDPRQQFEVVKFEESVQKMEDLKPGMKLPGIVTNITAFGAFVDIGVHQDGLIHISQLANHYVKSPSDVVKVHQKVLVTVMEVDLARKRIALTMKENQSPLAKDGKTKGLGSIPSKMNSRKIF